MRRNIIVLIESIMFAVFWVFGVEINKNGVVDFQDTLMYFKILGFIAIFFICITVLYIFLEKMEEKSENKLSEESSKINLKKYIIIAIIFFICWTPVFLAVFPGYFCYDASDQYKEFSTNSFKTHHPIFHTIILGSIVHSVYLLTGSHNAGIATFTVLQMIFASFVFSYSIYFMEKYKISKKIRILGIIYYCFFPVIHMFVFSSTKDTLFTLIMLLLIMCLIDVFILKEEFFKKKLNYIKLFALTILLCFLRNNGFYIIIGLIVISLFLCSSKIKFKFIITIAISSILFSYIFGIITLLPNVRLASPREMLSVPIQQMAYVYNYSYNITNEDKQKILTMFEEDILYQYVPELSDPIKKYFIYDEFFLNFKFYINLGLKCKGEYINSFLLNTVGYWYPNQIINGYNKAKQGIYENKKTSFFFSETIMPGSRHSFFPQLEKIYYNLASQAVVENIPIISLLFSIGANMWLIFMILGYSVYKKNRAIVIAISMIIFTWGTMLLGPIVLVRYILILFFMFPLNIALLINNNRFKEN